MLAVRLSEQTEDRLNHLAQETGRTKTYYAKKAIEEFLEDKEDYLLAVAVLEQKNPSVPLEKVVKDLGLES
jgi:RHH-type rel operon transcriptional repressor/antitoxin RelB